MLTINQGRACLKRSSRSERSWHRSAVRGPQLGLSIQVLLVFCFLIAGCRPADAPKPPAVTSPIAQSAAPSTISPLAAASDTIWQLVDPKLSGLQFVYKNGDEAQHCTILESLGGGIGILDYDSDGAMDLCVSGGGKFSAETEISGLPTGLFQNVNKLRFTDRSEASRISSSPYYSHGVAVGDFNNDGFSDVAITGYHGLLLWVNQGDGTFVECAAQVGIVNRLWSSSAAWGDLNGDGTLDLYVANYVDWSFQNHPVCRAPDGQRDICPPKSFSGLPHKIYYSQGDGTFRESSEHAGLKNDGKGLGVVLVDINADSRLDIYVANDTTSNFLYVNKGEGRFEEVGELSGSALDDRGLPNGSMGVDAFDYNLDGQLDLWVCNYEDETFALYRNQGAAHFAHVSKSTGLTSFGQRFVGFGTAAADFDFDGDEDIVVANGHVIKFPQRSPRRQLPLFLESQKGRFVRTPFSNDSYFGTAHEGRGLAMADFDNDGDADLAISHVNEAVSVLRNKQTSQEWLSVKLIGRASNRDAIGARLMLHTTASKQVRQIKGGGSYLSTHDLRVRWGFGPGQSPLKLEIEWPSGTQQVIDKLSSGSELVLLEPSP